MIVTWLADKNAQMTKSYFIQNLTVIWDM